MKISSSTLQGCNEWANSHVKRYAAEGAQEEQIDETIPVGFGNADNLQCNQSFCV